MAQTPAQTRAQIPAPLPGQILIFPGQGSQHRGMGSKLFEGRPDLVAQADAILGYSIRRLCLEDPAKQLNDTAFTQPALFVVTALAWMQWQDEHHGDTPLACAGHSLGEYTALLAAGVFDFGTGLELVRERGRLMALANGGAMAAVIGLTPERIEALLRSTGRDLLSVANVNTQAQTVIAGPAPDIEAASATFIAAGARYVRLNVSAAFHSSAMDAARQAFTKFLHGYELRTPRIPVLANLTAREYPRNPDDVKEVLAAQIAWPVRWYEIMSTLLACADSEISEIGPGNALTKMLAQIREQPLPTSAPRWALRGAAQAGESRAPDPVCHAMPTAAVTRARHEFSRGGRVFLYTGQGSQYYRMGEDLYREHPTYRAALDACFSIVRPRLPRPLEDVMFDGTKPLAPFDRMLYSNPALFAVGYGLTKVLYDRGIEPDGVMGYGVGELIAATIAGALTLEQALEFSIASAEELEAYTAPGAMLAVFGEPALFDREPALFTGCTLAGVNFSRHFILGGSVEAIEAAAARARERDLVTALLPIRHALHCDAMTPAAERALTRARKLNFAPIRVPLYSPTRGDWIEHVDAEFLWQAIRSRVNFAAAVEHLSSHRASFLDLGPSGTLAGFVRHQVGDPEKALAAISRFGRNSVSLANTVERLVRPEAPTMVSA